MKKIDPTTELVNSVMSQFVPPEGQLQNPFKSKKKGGKQVTMHDLMERKVKQALPDDVEQWNSKQIVEYFAKAYQTATGGNYKITYASDVPVIKQIGDFMASNGLPRNEWTKKLIDWGLLRHEEISRRLGYLTLTSIFRMVNYFYQDVVLPQVEQGEVDRDTCDTSLLDEIVQADKDGKSTEIFARYGIPVTVTYLHKIQKYDMDKINAVTEKRLQVLASGTAEDRQVLQRIVTSSILGSPYPEDFQGLDWRQRYITHVKQFNAESWWRSEDYKGKPLPKYRMLLGEAE